MVTPSCWAGLPAEQQPSEWGAGGDGVGGLGVGTPPLCALKNRLSLCGEQRNVIVSPEKGWHCHSRTHRGLSLQQGPGSPGETHPSVTMGTLGDTWLGQVEWASQGPGPGHPPQSDCAL